jgi:hypothetical protein
MLTTTYAFLSLSIEQQKLHNLLSETQQLFQINSAHRQHSDVATVSTVVEQFTKLDASCHKGKIEMYIIPAIQKATREADTLLDELESLNAARRQIHDSVKGWAQSDLAPKPTGMNDLYSSIGLYCDNLLERLVKEEQELLPLAKRVISSDDWFSMGTRFLSIDTEHMPRRRAADSRSGRAGSGAAALSDPLMWLVAGDDVHAG